MKVIMMGIRKITRLFNELACEVSIYNRVTNLIGSDGVVREKANQTGKVDYKCFKRAYKAWEELVC